MSLSTLLEEIKKARPFAEENVEQGAPQTLNARRGRKAQNIELLKRLKEDYTNNLRKSAAFVLVVGDKRNEFTAAATENFKCFSTDPDFFYTDLARRVPTSLYLGKEGMSNVFDILGRHLEEKMLDLGVGEYNQLIFKQEYRSYVGTPQEFVALIKRAINEQIGGEVVGYQSAKSLTDTAIDKNHAAKVTPILLPTSDGAFALTLAEALENISTRVFIVAAGATEFEFEPGEALIVKEPTDESVKKTLKTISNSLKK